MSQPRRLCAHWRSARMQTFLHTKCFPCFLLDSLQHAWNSLCPQERNNFQLKHPYCTMPMVLYDNNEDCSNVLQGARAFAFEQITNTPFVDPPQQPLVENYENPWPTVQLHAFNWAESCAEWAYSRTAQRPTYSFMFLLYLSCFAFISRYYIWYLILHLYIWMNFDCSNVLIIESWHHSSFCAFWFFFGPFLSATGVAWAKRGGMLKKVLK